MMEEKSGDFVWCLHCERVFVFYRRVYECAYCGSTTLDWSVWGGHGFMDKSILKRYGYPMVPVVGRYYALYPKGVLHGRSNTTNRYVSDRSAG